MKSLAKINYIVQRISLVLLILFVSLVFSGSAPTTAGHQDLPPTGMICTTNPTATFTLTTRTGHITMPDGNVLFMWGFSEGDNEFQHPGPILCVNEGDTVTVVLNNTLAEDVSIIFPGQTNVFANGMPSQPVYNGVGDLVSLAPVATANGGSVTYSFVASRPGTFIYESGVETTKQVNMGLFGGVVVRPAASPEWAYNEVVTVGITSTITTQFNPNAEYLIMMSEIDPMLHVAVEQGLPYDMTNYRARYFLFNGRSFPDTVASNGAAWLPNQPYSSLTYIHPFDDQPTLEDGVTPNPGYNPYPALIRYLSVGSEDYPQHPHGNHGRVIARDGHVLVGVAGQDLSFEKFTVVVGPGQTWDVLFDWRDVEKWNPVDNPIPVAIPQLQNLTFGTFYSGSPYLGDLDQLPVGTQALNQCGEYYHIAHNHALQQITAWGVVLSGQITFTRIDPPLPNNCP